MKNLVATVALMAVGLASVAQEWLPADFTSYTTASDWDGSYNEWSYSESSSMFFYVVEDDAIGIKNAYIAAIGVLAKADLDLMEPDNDFSYLASYVKHKLDYASLSMSVNAGSSEVLMYWIHEDYRISVSFTETLRGVFIVKE